MATATDSRVCAEPGCATILSRFNEDDRCAIHAEPEEPDEPRGRQPKLCSNESCFNTASTGWVGPGARGAADVVVGRSSGLCRRCFEEMSTTATQASANGSGPKFQPKSCSGCGNEFNPTGPRALYCDDCKAGPSGTLPAAEQKPRKQRQPKPKPPKREQPTPERDPRQRYLDLLLAKAEAQDDPSDDLLDRIEAQLEACAAS